MECINFSYYYLNGMKRKIATTSNIDTLNDFKNCLEKFKSSKLGSFNYTMFLLGVVATHTGVIFYTKQVLHEMESKAPRHLGICLTVGLMSGLIFGSMYGKSISLYRTFSSVERDLNNKIQTYSSSKN